MALPPGLTWPIGQRTVNSFQPLPHLRRPRAWWVSELAVTGARKVRRTDLHPLRPLSRLLLGLIAGPQCFPPGTCGPLALEARPPPWPALIACTTRPCSPPQCASAYNGFPGHLSPQDPRGLTRLRSLPAQATPLPQDHLPFLIPHLWNFGLLENHRWKAHESCLPEPSTFFVGQSKASLQSSSGPLCRLLGRDVPLPLFRLTSSLSSDPQHGTGGWGAALPLVILAGV